MLEYNYLIYFTIYQIVFLREAVTIQLICLGSIMLRINLNNYSKTLPLVSGMRKKNANADNKYAPDNKAKA